jgi:hypothetical protein
MAFQPADQIGRHEGVDAGLRSLSHEVPESGERHARRSALIDNRRYPRLHADEIGIEPEAAGHVLVAVRMGVDQARQNQAIRHIRYGLRPRAIDARFNRRNAAVAHRDIHHAIQAGGGTDDASPGQQKIIWPDIAH